MGVSPRCGARGVGARDPREASWIPTIIPHPFIIAHFELSWSPPRSPAERRRRYGVGSGIRGVFRDAGRNAGNITSKVKEN